MTHLSHTSFRLCKPLARLATTALLSSVIQLLPCTTTPSRHHRCLVDVKQSRNIREALTNLRTPELVRRDGAPHPTGAKGEMQREEEKQRQSLML